MLLHSFLFLFSFLSDPSQAELRAALQGAQRSATEAEMQAESKGQKNGRVNRVFSHCAPNEPGKSWKLIEFESR